MSSASGSAAELATEVPGEVPPGRPEFIEGLSQAYYGGLCRCVVLSGNIHDLFPIQISGALRFVPLDQALRSVLAQARYPRRGGTEKFIVVTLKGEGIGFASGEDPQELRELTSRLTRDAFHIDPGLGQGLREALQKQPGEGLPMAGAFLALQRFLKAVAGLRSRGVMVRPVAAVVDYADALFPNRDVGSLAREDREALVCLGDLLRDEQIWASPETAETRPDILLLLTPTVTGLNPQILTLPGSVAIEIPLPDEATRRLFIEERTRSGPIQLEYPGSSDPAEDFARDARGLALRSLDAVITRGQRLGSPVGRSAVTGEVNRYIQAKLGAAVRIVWPDHGMEDVIGFRKLKLRLERLKRRIDDPSRAPAGMTVVGPNGSGKTFICEAFAAHTGRVCVTFGQLRSQWFGQTDVLAEMFESTLSAFGRILVLVDEAHVAFGSIHERETHETEARLARHIIQMMDNESTRSHIFWALMTTRPDLLDPDIVRRGRCSLFVPIFDPEGEDAEDFLSWAMARFQREGVALTKKDRDLLRERTGGFSAGDYREFIADFLDERDFNSEVTLREFLDQWTPSAVALARERAFQIHLAALRCDWRELLPQRLRDVSREEIQREVERLKVEEGLW